MNDEMNLRSLVNEASAYHADELREELELRRQVLHAQESLLAKRQNRITELESEAAVLVTLVSSQGSRFYAAAATWAKKARRRLRVEPKPRYGRVSRVAAKQEIQRLVDVEDGLADSRWHPKDCRPVRPRVPGEEVKRGE